MSVDTEPGKNPELADAVSAVSMHVHTDLVALGAGEVAPTDVLVREWLRLADTHPAYGDNIRALGLAVVDASDAVSRDQTLMGEGRAHFSEVEHPGAQGLLSLLVVARRAATPRADTATQARGMLAALGPDAHKVTLNGVVEHALVGTLRPVHRRPVRRRPSRP